MEMDFHKLPVEQVPNALIATSPNSEVPHWNHSAKTTFGDSGVEADGSFSELIVRSDRIEKNPEIQRQALKSGAAPYELVRRAKDRSAIDIKLTNNGIKSTEHGSVRLQLGPCLEILSNGFRRQILGLSSMAELR